MSDLLPIPALPPAPPEPQRRPSRWWRLTHPRAARRARLLAAHHAWTTQRARQAQIDLVRAGYHLGPVPFGYRPQRLTVPDAGGVMRRRVRLIVDPAPAATVAVIYRWRIEDRLNHTAIVTRLTVEPDWYPTPLDPYSHTPRPWTPEAVARILTNPVYTGATVWGRTVAGRPVPPEEWVVCQDAHEPIVDGRTFFAAQLLAPRGTGIISVQFPAWDFLNARATGPRQGSWEANSKPFI